MVDDSTTANELRLTPRQWLAAAPLIAVVLIAPPLLWDRLEPFEPTADYRMPRAQSNDYWTFARWSRLAAGRDDVLVLGDSVVWGETVGPRQTLSARLTALAAAEGRAERFANLGLSGGYPAVLPALLAEYAPALAGRRVLLHCNLRWLNSLQADLQEPPPNHRLNHPRLLPQWPGAVPVVEAGLADRFNVAASRKLPLVNWSDHLQQAYFDGGFARWSLEHPCENPFARITCRLPEPKPDDVAPDFEGRGPPPRTDYAWVTLADSVQWAQLRRAVQWLRSRGCRLVVCVGPLNRHMLTEAGKGRYEAVEAAAIDWLAAEGVPHVRPAMLAADRYDDLSHPNADGYADLAAELWSDPTFRAALGMAAPTP
jgi:hypothetical protein